MNYYALAIYLALTKTLLFQQASISSPYHFGGICSELLKHSHSGVYRYAVLHCGQFQGNDQKSEIHVGNWQGEKNGYTTIQGLVSGDSKYDCFHCMFHDLDDVCRNRHPNQENVESE